MGSGRDGSRGSSGSASWEVGDGLGTGLKNAVIAAFLDMVAETDAARSYGGRVGGCSIFLGLWTMR